MIRELIVLCAVLVAGRSNANASTEDKPLPRGALSHSSMLKDCGASCVAIVGNLAGPAEVPFERAKELVDPDGDGLASMHDLVRGLATLGIAATSMQSSSLEVPDGVNILHVTASETSGAEDHFIVSEELPDGRFRFYCPPLGTKTGGRTALEGMWSGCFIRVGAPREHTWLMPVSIATVGLLVGAFGARAVRGAQRGREVVHA